MFNEHITEVYSHLILWYYFLLIHNNNVKSKIINYTKLCNSGEPNILEPIIDWNLSATLKSVTEKLMYNNFVENKLLLANKLMCDALIFFMVSKRRTRIWSLWKHRKNSTLAASENQTHDSLRSRLDDLTTELLELHGEKTRIYCYMYPFSDIFYKYVSVMF